tara:strand:- start:222 stop:545 length:324 start_codon:yes stop_codon:yes gene_type:complete
MNSAYTKPKNVHNYIIPKGRLAQVSSIQDYSKEKKPKIHERVTLKDYNARTGSKEFPIIHKQAPQLLHGKVKTKFKQNEIFELDNTKPKKIKKVKLAYVDPMTGRFN